MLRAVVAALALAVAVPVAAQEISANLVAGEPGSTELRAGQDLAALAAGCGLSITARETGGAVENMQAVRDRRATQLGIVQGDVLEYFRTYENDDPDLRRPAQGVRVVFPLFDEEVHVIARREIGSSPISPASGSRPGFPAAGPR